VHLDDEMMRQKLAMAACHRSQLRAMLDEFPELVEPAGSMRRELYWTSDSQDTP
jgi:LmbE family N-acetylglucosaminyl deacetylase